MATKEKTMKCQFQTLIVTLLIILGAQFSGVKVSALEMSQSETLVISDIDDTLKNTHVLDRWEALQNALRTENAFVGMSSLFQLLQKNTPEIDFVYLSNAPESLMYTKHLELLRKAQFPEGELILRQDSGDADHKIKAIRELVLKYHPAHLILIGDNGEKDALIYRQAIQDFPELQIEVYIHQVYSVIGEEKGQKLQPGQNGFVTAIDLALSWYFQGRLNQQEVERWLGANIAGVIQEPEDQSHGSLAFPEWVDCRDYRPHFPAISDQLVQLYFAKLYRRCQLQ